MANPRYDTPPKGTTEWHLPLNGNFDKIYADNVPFSQEAPLSGDLQWEPNVQESVPLDGAPIAVPYPGNYMVTATVEVDTSSLTERVYAATVITVNGNREEVESGDIGPVVGPDFASVTAPYPVHELSQGDQIGMRFQHSGSNPVRMTSQDFNTKLKVVRMSRETMPDEQGGSIV